MTDEMTPDFNDDTDPQSDLTVELDTGRTLEREPSLYPSRNLMAANRPPRSERG